MRYIALVCFMIFSSVFPAGTEDLVQFPIEVANTHYSEINAIHYSKTGDYFFVADSIWVYRCDYLGRNLDMNDCYSVEFNSLERDAIKSEYPVLAHNDTLFLEVPSPDEIDTELPEDYDGISMQGFNSRMVNLCTYNKTTGEKEVLIELYAGTCDNEQFRRAALGPNGHMVISFGKGFVIWQWDIQEKNDGTPTLLNGD